jgi:hypothetical protein
MTAVRTVRSLAAIAVISLAVGCSKSSTGPSDPFAGSWRVTVNNLIYNGDIPPDTGTVSPSPFTLGIASSGRSYTATWPSLTWAVTVSGQSGTVAFPASASVTDSISVAGDSLTIFIPVTTLLSGCEVIIAGAYQGSGAQGRVYLAGGQCGSVAGGHLGDGSWTATKQ